MPIASITTKFHFDPPVYWRIEIMQNGTYVLERDGHALGMVDKPSLRVLYRAAQDAKYQYQHWNLCELRIVDYDPQELVDRVLILSYTDLPNGMKGRWSVFNLAGKLHQTGHYDVAFNSHSKTAPYLVMGNGCRIPCADFAREPDCEIELPWPRNPPEGWEYQPKWVANYIRDKLLTEKASIAL